MSNKKTIIQIIAITILMILVGSLLINKTMAQSDESDLVEKFHIHQEIDYLYIDTIMDDVSIYKSDTEEMEIRATGISEYPIQVQINHDIIRIEREKRDWTNWFYHYRIGRIEIYLPSHQFEKVDIKLVLGTLDLKYLNADRIEISTLSGDIDAKIEAKEITIKTLSGQINGLLEAEEISLETISGDLMIDIDNSPDKISIETVSGSIEFGWCDGYGIELTLNTLSGKIDTEIGEMIKQQSKYSNEWKLQYKECSSRVEIETLSSNVEIKKR